MQRVDRGIGPDAPTRWQAAMRAARLRLRVWPFLVGLARAMRRGVALAGLLVAAWLGLGGPRWPPRSAPRRWCSYARMSRTCSRHYPAGPASWGSPELAMSWSARG